MATIYLIENYISNNCRIKDKIIRQEKNRKLKADKREASKQTV